MNGARYFRDGNCYWKFAPGSTPKQKTGFHSDWEDSYFQDLDEFLNDPGTIEEIDEDEAEMP